MSDDKQQATPERKVRDLGKVSFDFRPPQSKTPLAHTKPAAEPVKEDGNE